ncbi:hypothetical protein [Paenibacillus tepidiphilus]|uniref:hypothetical protein n=1 Tax=Paenibacillus tepidiphilus TaxID=2608683 RepID=UPI00123C288C|nr:hypothetical protein [Paenibacillus tepidiphilus]
MRRCLYRAEHQEGQVNDPAWLNVLEDGLRARMNRLAVDQLSLFSWETSLFLYYECLGEQVEPEDLLVSAKEYLAAWPGGWRGRHWAPMTDIFHYQYPVSRQHWERRNPEREPYGRIALLKPEEISSYIYYHYQYQEERPGDGDKYGIIGLHENMLFFYAEQPTVRETAPYAGKLNTSLRPDNWGEVMDPHFIKWTDAPAGQEIWRRLELVLEVRSDAGRMGAEHA